MSQTFFRKVFQLTWGKYLQALSKRPLLTQSLTTGVLMASGDAIAQIQFSSNTNFDYIRSLKFFMVGSMFLGPCLRTWYILLSKRFQGSPGINAVKMVIVDQLFMAPTINFSLICIFAGLNGARTFDDFKSPVLKDFAGILINNYKLWPAAQMINFYLIPLQFRVLYVNFIALIWNVYLSFAINKN